ncbi:MAG: hypothetical protein ACXW0T_13845 [Methylobacter sp.]
MQFKKSAIPDASSKPGTTIAKLVDQAQAGAIELVYVDKAGLHHNRLIIQLV